MKRVLVLNLSKLVADGTDFVSLQNAGYELVFSNDPDTPPVLMHNPDPVTRRERIATEMLSGLLSGTCATSERDRGGQLFLAKYVPVAVELADALVKELDK